MKKLRSLNVIEGFNYGLPPSSPPSNRSITIQSVFGGYDQHYAAEGEQSTNEGQEYIEEVDSVLVDVKPKAEAPNEDKKEDQRAQLF